MSSFSRSKFQRGLKVDATHLPHWEQTQCLPWHSRSSFRTHFQVGYEPLKYNQRPSGGMISSTFDERQHEQPYTDTCDQFAGSRNVACKARTDANRGYQVMSNTWLSICKTLVIAKRRSARLQVRTIRLPQACVIRYLETYLVIISEALSAFISRL